MANMANVQVSAAFQMDTMDPRTEVVTSWFKLKIHGYEWTDIYVGLSKRSGDWLSGCAAFFDLDIDTRTKCLTEARALLEKMR